MSNDSARARIVGPSMDELWLAVWISAYLLVGLFFARQHRFNSPPRTKFSAYGGQVTRWGEHVCGCMLAGLIWPATGIYLALRPGFIWFFTDPKVRREAKAEAAKARAEEAIRSAYVSALDIHAGSKGDDYLTGLAVMQLALAESLGEPTGLTMNQYGALDTLRRERKRSTRSVNRG